MNILYFKEIKEAAERYGLDPLMVASVVLAESNFKADAVSRVGAKGLMQLMPNTDKWLDDDIDGFDVEGNLDNGCRYLDWLKKYFNKRFPEIIGMDLWRIVWAGYNAGQGNIKKALELAKVNSLWYQFDIWKKYLPEITGKHSEETTGYVKKIDKFWTEYKAESQSDFQQGVLISREQLICLDELLQNIQKILSQFREKE